MLPYLLPALAAVLAAALTYVATLRRDRTTAAHEQATDAHAARDELWREVAAQRERVGVLEERVDVLQRDLVAARELASVRRVVIRECAAAARGHGRDDCPVLAILAALPPDADTTGHLRAATMPGAPMAVPTAPRPDTEEE